MRQNPTTGELKPILLSHIHRLSNNEELTRLSDFGARLQDQFIVHPKDTGIFYPRKISLTRTVGYLEFGEGTGVISEPQGSEIDLTRDDRYLLLATDGLCDCIDPKTLASLLKGSPQNCVQNILDYLNTEVGATLDDTAIIIKSLDGFI